MSGKIKAKDLSYDSSLPPFLQRLHAQNAGRGDLDRHERPTARPKKAKDPNADDDGPTVVDRTGETISKEEYERLAKADVKDDDVDNSVGGAVTGEVVGHNKVMISGALQDGGIVKRPGQKVTEGTAQKKRKAARVVGPEEQKDEQQNEDEKDESKTANKPKKKAKPIKLAFEEDEGS